MSVLLAEHRVHRIHNATMAVFVMVLKPASLANAYLESRPVLEPALFVTKAVTVVSFPGLRVQPIASATMVVFVTVLNAVSVAPVEAVPGLVWGLNSSAVKTPIVVC